MKDGKLINCSSYLMFFDCSHVDESIVNFVCKLCSRASSTSDMKWRNQKRHLEAHFVNKALIMPWMNAYNEKSKHQHKQKLNEGTLKLVK